MFKLIQFLKLYIFMKKLIKNQSIIANIHIQKMQKNYNYQSHDKRFYFNVYVNGGWSYKIMDHNYQTIYKCFFNPNYFIQTGIQLLNLIEI